METTKTAVCGAKAALAHACYCDLPAGHEGQHALHQDGKVYRWGKPSTPVEYSYTPLDVGFDLRRHPEMRITLPHGERLRVRYMAGGGEAAREKTVEGSRREVVRVLRNYGYRVEAVEGEASP